MTQMPFASSRSFRRNDGVVSDDASAVLSAAVTTAHAQTTGQSGRWLVATVEPTTGSEYAWEVAHRALEALRQGFAAQYDATVTQALARGFAAANACVRAANRGDLGRRRGERVFVGASALVVDGTQLILAHVPPSQVLFTQDRMVYAIPSLHSWEPHYAGSDRSQARPLGAADQVHPDIFQTSIAPQDTFVLCSTNLGRAMTGLSAIEERLRPPSDPSGRPMSSLPVGPAEHPITLFDIGAIRPAGPDPAKAWVDWLDHVATERHVPSCHAIAVTVGRLDRRGNTPSTRRSRGRQSSRSSSPEPEPGPAPRPAPAPAQPPAIPTQPGRPQLLNVPVPPVTAAPGLALHRLPGAHGVSRHADASWSDSALWRSMSPRIGIGTMPSIPRWFSLSLVLALVLTLGLGAAHMRQASTQETLSLELSRIDTRLAAAETGNDASELGTLRGQLETLSARYGPSEAIAERGIRLTAIEDHLLGRTRLEAADPLGAVPASLSAAGRPIRLVQSNSGIYVVGSALYALDTSGNELVELLTPGAMVEGLVVGPILDAVATRSGVAITDGRALFSRGASGTWTAQAFQADLPLGDQGAAAIVVTDGQVVAVDRATGTLVSRPMADTATGGSPYLPPELVVAFSAVRDLGLDGELFILSDDHGLISWDAGQEPVHHEVPVSPPLEDVRALDIAGSGVWIMDAGTGSGRLIHFLPEDGTTRTFALPVNGVSLGGPLTDATDFAIDLDTGRFVFVSGNALWAVPMPTAG